VKKRERRLKFEDFPHKKSPERMIQPWVTEWKKMSGDQAMGDAMISPPKETFAFKI
jgi:hypothetical protein